MELLSRPEVVLRDVPRSDLVERAGGGTRRITSLGPADDETYRRLVAHATPAIERSLAPGVVANRVTGPGLRLEDWRAARRRWRRATAPRGAGVRLALDVADCYAAIAPAVVADALAGVGAPDQPELIRLLHELAACGVPGLPVGPPASAVLANAVLIRLDQAVTAAGVPHVRWVDDVVVTARSRPQAIRAMDAVRRELGAIALRVQDTKTRLDDARRPPTRPVPSAAELVR